MDGSSRTKQHLLIAIVFMLVVCGGLFSVDYIFAENKKGVNTPRREERVFAETTPLSAGVPMARAEEKAEEIINEKEAVDLGYILQKEHLLRDQMSARSYLVGDLDTGEIIIEKNATDIHPIASISKYVTALASLDLLDQGDVVTITDEMLETNGNRLGVKEGETIKVGSLLYPLLLVSSNDAAEALAQYRDRALFITHMNQIARTYGLINTTFDDPSGLSAGNHSTARDLFKLMRAIREEHPEIIDISRLSSFEIDDYKWSNTNRAKDLVGFQGGKTGYTNAARQTSIGYYKIKTANEQEKNIGVIILQSGERERDAKRILDYIDRYVSYIKIER